MIRNQTMKVATIAAAMMAFGSYAVIVADPANAARGSRDVIEQSYTTDKAMHGYSGSAGGYTCDYQRIPNRVCTVNRDGSERCKIVNWTLKQFCY